jgi:light-harvesting protein B-800-850 alpha chain
MIYGKLWLVVKPTVGIPLFLSGVAIASAFVHLALLTNTTWIKKYLNGNTPAATAQVDESTPTAAAPPTVVVATAPAAK